MKSTTEKGCTPGRPGWIERLYVIVVAVIGYSMTMASVFGLVALGMSTRQVVGAYLIVSLASALAWLIPRACLGKFRPGCAPAVVRFGWGRGIDAAACAQAMVGFWGLIIRAVQSQIIHDITFPLIVVAFVINSTAVRWITEIEEGLIAGIGKKSPMAVGSSWDGETAG
ncbi:hypothetical protein TA3x_004350 [Tundrisphaera sp. TA3]|uniref:hypothetical protein n=1 Tax=Tundrisphaera sp. TA3 TaxID=3435775 RepID=UPI003EBCA15A